MPQQCKCGRELGKTGDPQINKHFSMEMRVELGYEGLPKAENRCGDLEGIPGWASSRLLLERKFANVKSLVFPLVCIFDLLWYGWIKPQKYTCLAIITVSKFQSYLTYWGESVQTKNKHKTGVELNLILSKLRDFTKQWHLPTKTVDSDLNLNSVVAVMYEFYFQATSSL